MERQETREKRRRFFGIVFIIGVSSAFGACIAYVAREPWLSWLLGMGWFLSVAIYSEFLTIPRTFMQDMDLRWHLNPWQEALQRLAADNRKTQGIILLAIFPILRMIGAFISFGLK